MLKSSSCWLTFAKIHHWGHNNIGIVYTFIGPKQGKRRKMGFSCCAQNNNNNKTLKTWLAKQICAANFACTLIKCIRKADKSVKNSYIHCDLSGGFLRRWVNRNLILANKSVKEKYFFDLTFIDVHMGRQKAPKSDFQSRFSLSKIVRIFLIFFFIEEYQYRRSFFDIVIFWKLQFLNHFGF